MKINKKIFPIIVSAITGLIAGTVILFIYPSTGKKIGDLIYSNGISVESYSYAVAKAAPSVVNIYVAELNDDYITPNTSKITSSASGVILNDNGVIVTNYHVVTSASEPGHGVWVQTRDGKIFNALVIGTDRRTDIAVLKINAKDIKAISTAKYDVKVGDVVLAIGNPNNLGQTVTHGIISALARSGSGLLTKDIMNIRQGVQELIQTDAPINNGNSGGALVNTRGDLVGINTASFNSENTYGIGFSVPVKMVMQVVNEILTHGKVERGYLGISDVDTNPLDNSEGVTVGFIDPHGPAQGIIEVGDVIKKVDDKNIKDVKELISLISSSKPGATLKFELLRGKETLIRNITLIEDQSSIE
jgi:serine protease DegS